MNISISDMFFLEKFERDHLSAQMHGVLNEDRVLVVSVFEYLKSRNQHQVIIDPVTKEDGRVMWRSAIKDGYSVVTAKSQLKNRQYFIYLMHVVSRLYDGTANLAKKALIITATKLTNTQAHHNKFYDVYLFSEYSNLEEQATWICDLGSFSHYGRLGASGTNTPFEPDATGASTSKLIYTKLAKGYTRV